MTAVKSLFSFLCLASILVFAAGCGDNRDVDNQGDNEVTIGDADAGENAEMTATAVLQPTQGNDSVKGTVTFTQTNEGMRIAADIQGLTPGDHGFHVHESGDCSAPDASSAGGHFAGRDSTHGAPEDSSRHTGDMGNITADEDGRAQREWIDPYMTFDGENSILGKAVIVHAGKDDLKSQPAGNSGARVACGVIERNQ